MRSSLSAEVLELFADLADASRAHYEMQLELWCLWSRERHASADRAKDWRAANREHVRAYDAARRQAAKKARARRKRWAAYVAQWRAARPINQCRDCAEPAVPGKRSCAGHLAKARARAARSGGVAPI